MTSRRGSGGPEASRDVGRAVSWTLVVAASALIILAGVGWRTIASLRLRLEAAELELESVSADLRGASNAGHTAALWVELIGSDHARQEPLSPTSHRRSTMGGRVLFDSTGGTIGVLLWNVPPRVQARYRVWGLVGDDRVGLGSVTPGPDGRAALGPIVSEGPPFTGALVTRESSAGSSTGDGPIVLEADLRP